MSAPRRVLTLLVCVLSAAPLAAEGLPPRAVARLGSYRFYHGPGVRWAVLSPDGSRIASTAEYPSYWQHISEKEHEEYDRLVILWDAATGERLREWRLPHAAGYLAFSPDGQQLAARFYIDEKQAGILLLDVESGEEVRRLEGFDGDMRRLRFSEDGKQLLVSEGSSAVTRCDVATGKVLRRWEPPGPPSVWITAHERVTEGIPSPDGKLIAWLVCDVSDYSTLPVGVLRPGVPVPWPTVLVVTDTATGKPLYRQEFERKVLEGFTFSADGQQFMTGRGEFTAWDSATGEELFAVDTPGLSVLWRFAMSPDGGRAVIADGWSRVQLWDLDTRKVVHDLYPGFTYMASDTLESPQVFSADGKTLLLATDSTLRLFDTTTGKERVVPGHRTPVTPRFSADGRTLFTICGEATSRWDVSSGKEPALLAHEPRRDWKVLAMTRSADGRLFLDDPERFVRVRDAATGRVLCELEGKRSAYFGTFSPDATRVLLWHSAEAGEDADPARIYDAATGKKTGEISPVNRAGYPVFSPNGRLVAWAKQTNDVLLHDGATGELVRTLRSSEQLPKRECNDAHLLFSPDGEYLIVTTELDDHKAAEVEPRDLLPTRIFHVRSGKEMMRFYSNPEKTNKAAPLSCAACSPDSRLLALAEKESGTVRVIELASGKVRLELAGHRHGVHALAFSPDGKTLASGGADNVVLLWDVAGTRTGVAVRTATEKDLAAWWNDLAAEDAKRAGDAVSSLIRTPGESVGFLKGRVRPVEPVDEKRLARLLAELDAETFEQREAASRELARLGERAEATVRRAIKEDAPPEAKRRLAELVERLEQRTIPPETLRLLRAVEALEHLGTPEARQLLEAVAGGASEARLTREARASLRRLAGRAR
jgi:WD40 repeat protein